MKEIVIIGGGPAGLTAGIYAVRGGADTLLLEEAFPGGQIVNTTMVENYPGFPDGIDGIGLGNAMQKQAEKLGLSIVYDTVTGVEFTPERKLIHTTGETIEAKKVIIATGSSPRKLAVEGEEKFTGCGISYCAVCDAALYRNAVVAVAGGGDTALTDALHLTRFAKKVYLIHRRDKYRAGEALQKRIAHSDIIEPILNSKVVEVLGTDKVTGVVVENTLTSEQKTLELDGVFVAVGTQPRSQVFADEVKCTDEGYIETDAHMMTSVDGVYAVGDIRNTVLRQVITAAADGAIAATHAVEMLMG